MATIGALVRWPFRFWNWRNVSWFDSEYRACFHGAVRNQQLADFERSTRHDEQPQPNPSRTDHRALASRPGPVEGRVPRPPLLRPDNREGTLRALRGHAQ